MRLGILPGQRRGDEEMRQDIPSGGDWTLRDPTGSDGLFAATAEAPGKVRREKLRLLKLAYGAIAFAAACNPSGMIGAVMPYTRQRPRKLCTRRSGVYSGSIWHNYRR